MRIVTCFQSHEASRRIMCEEETDDVSSIGERQAQRQAEVWREVMRCRR